MAVLEQFILYNLLPAIVAGMLAWLFVAFALNTLKIEYGWMRLCLLYVPIIKSILVLLGIGLVMQWPREVFASWSAQSIPYSQIIPYVLVWLGLTLLLRSYFDRRARELALENSEPARDAAPRLHESMQRVQAAYDKLPSQMVGSGAIVCVCQDTPPAKVRVSKNGLDTPLILINEKEPTIVFPLDLVAELEDEELDGALAHEYAHFMLTNPVWCSSQGVRYVAPVSPIAQLLSGQLEREEEKACDDMAITALGNSEPYTEMLLKSYRFAAVQKAPLHGRLKALPQLLGVRPIFTERVERLVNETSSQRNIGIQFFAMCAVWVGFSILFGYA